MKSLERFKIHSAAKSQLAEILNDRKNFLIIHYSCESFYNSDGSSPRITSIAVRSLEADQTTSFSIFHLAEREKIKSEAIRTNYDKLEKKLLEEFYGYVGRYPNHKWLHWKMRNIKYGFAALAHRYRVLGGNPVEIPESHCFDLSRLLERLYGINYIPHQRLTQLTRKNQIYYSDFLSGEEEAHAFERGEYLKLHQSTLRKVEVLEKILRRAVDGTLKTDAKRREIYGGYLQFMMKTVREHWVFALVSILGAIASIVALFITLK